MWRNLKKNERDFIRLDWHLYYFLSIKYLMMNMNDYVLHPAPTISDSNLN